MENYLNNDNVKGIMLRMQDAKRCRCWRVVCARIRDLAKALESYGIPYKETLDKYNYNYYRNDIKNTFEQ